MYRLAENFIKVYAEKNGSTVARIKGRMKTPKQVKIRSECMRHILINTDLSRTEVGHLFDNRSRTTVLRLLEKLRQSKTKRQSGNA